MRPASRANNVTETHGGHSQVGARGPELQPLFDGSSASNLDEVLHGVLTNFITVRGPLWKTTPRKVCITGEGNEL